MAEALQPLSGTRRAPRRDVLLRRVPALTLAVFLAPIAAGLIGTWLPAFGYFPALGGATLGIEAWRQLLAFPGLPGALTLTLTVGFGATAASLGLAVAFVATCQGTRLFRRFRHFLAPLLAVPHVAVAIGLAFLLAPSGWLVRLVSPWATGWETPPDLALVQDPFGITLGLGLVVKELPYLLLMILAALDHAQADQRLAVARSLGYGPVHAWIKTVLPAIYRQIRLPLYAVLAFSLSVVDMALILAPLTPPPLAVLVFRWFNDPDLSMRFIGAAGAALQLLLVVGAILLWRGLEWSIARLGRHWLIAGGRGGNGRAARGLAVGVVGLLYTAAAASLVALAIWSLARRWRYPDGLPSAWTLDTWQRQADGLAWSAGTTLIVGLCAAGIALALTLACLENEKRRGLGTSGRVLWLLYIPLLVPQVGFLFGVQVLSVQMAIDGSWIALIWSHLLFVLPYVFLTLADPFRKLDERYARTGLCLGASPDRVFWRIKLPLLLRPVLFALAIGFAVSVAQYLPTMFAGGGRFVTLTTEAVGLAGGADRRVMGVYAFVQAILPLFAFAAAMAIPAWRFRARRAFKGGS